MNTKNYECLGTPHIYTKQHHRYCRYRYRILLPKGMPIPSTSNLNQANTSSEPHCNTVLLRRSLPPAQHQRRLQRLFLGFCPHRLFPLRQHLHLVVTSYCRGIGRSLVPRPCEVQPAQPRYSVPPTIFMYDVSLDMYNPVLFRRSELTTSNIG
jgi:hypothetical protein